MFILLLELGSHFGGEIFLLLLDALAEGKTQETRELDRGADLLGRVLHNLGNFGLDVNDEGLLEQHDLLLELAQAALDHLGDNLRRLA